MSRTRAQVEAAARQALELGHLDFQIIAVEPCESGQLYVITVPLTVVRRGLSGETTKFGWALMSNLNAIQGYQVSHYAGLPTGFTLHVSPEVASGPLPNFRGITRGLPADACLVIQTTIMRYRKRRHTLADFFRGI